MCLISKASLFIFKHFTCLLNRKWALTSVCLAKCAFFLEFDEFIQVEPSQGDHQNKNKIKSFELSTWREKFQLFIGIATEFPFFNDGFAWSCSLWRHRAAAGCFVTDKSWYRQKRRRLGRSHSAVLGSYNTARKKCEDIASCKKCNKLSFTKVICSQLYWRDYPRKKIGNSTCFQNICKHISLNWLYSPLSHKRNLVQLLNKVECYLCTRQIQTCNAFFETFAVSLDLKPEQKLHS